MNLTRLLALAAVLACAAACSPRSDGTELAGDAGQATSAKEPEVRRQTQPTLGLNESVATARADLAERLDLEPGLIEVEQARRVTWADGAMGCPEPGMHYTMALVDGYFIRLTAGGKPFAYHAGHDGQPFLCPTERSQTPRDGDEIM